MLSRHKATLWPTKQCGIYLRRLGIRRTSRFRPGRPRTTEAVPGRHVRYARTSAPSHGRRSDREQRADPHRCCTPPGRPQDQATDRTNRGQHSLSINPVCTLRGRKPVDGPDTSPARGSSVVVSPLPQLPRGGPSPEDKRNVTRHCQVVLDFVRHSHVFTDGRAKTRPRFVESSEVTDSPHSQHVLDRTLNRLVGDSTGSPR